jgi:hypothetical protein
VRELKHLGFSKLKWQDVSHVVGFQQQQPQGAGSRLG